VRFPEDEGEHQLIQRGFLPCCQESAETFYDGPGFDGSPNRSNFFVEHGQHRRADLTPKLGKGLVLGGKVEVVIRLYLLL